MQKSRRSIAVVVYFIVGVVCLVFFGLGVFSNVEMTYSDEDIIAIQSLNLDSYCLNAPGTFERERACVSEVKHKVDGLMFKPCDFKFELDRNISELMRNGSRCCYNTSRLQELILNFYSFPVRHVFLLQKRNSNPLKDFFLPGNSSHAVTEVKTQRGWIFLASVSPGATGLEISNASVLEVRNILRKNLHALSFWDSEYKFEDIFFGGDFYIIYGLYSRLGNLYRRLPFPNLNWSQFAQNFDWFGE